jgi:nudix-type nucleoside diphosphatase (YffH/AdpP family)
VVSREVERHGNAAAVLPYDVARRTALVVRRFRPPFFDAVGDAPSEEARAGMIEAEDAETAVRREAHEELGVALGVLEFVARIWSSPGVSTERQSLFLAAYGMADRIGVDRRAASKRGRFRVVGAIAVGGCGLVSGSRNQRDYTNPRVPI